MKLKAFLTLSLFVLGASAAHAVSGPDFFYTDAIGNVSISTSAWTAVPTTNSVARLAIVVQEYPTNTGNMLVRISSTTTAPPAATNVGMTLHPTDGPQLFSLSDKLQVYVKSQAAVAENLFYQELK